MATDGVGFGVSVGIVGVWLSQARKAGIAGNHRFPRKKGTRGFSRSARGHQRTHARMHRRSSDLDLRENTSTNEASSFTN